MLRGFALLVGLRQSLMARLLEPALLLLLILATAFVLLVA
jgi:hypothetical protein